MAAWTFIFTLFFIVLTLAREAFYDPLLPQIPLIPQPESPRRQPGEQEFQLRHLFHHGGKKYPTLHKRLDVHPTTYVWVQDKDHKRPLGQLRASSRNTKMQRLADRSRERMELLQLAGRAKGSPVGLAASEWRIDNVIGPDITDRETVTTLAKMALDAYVKEPGQGDWQDVGGGFNQSDAFGWWTDGLRGQIFATADNNTIVVSIKGTSIGMDFFDGPTGSITRDRENDNLFFSCCCAAEFAVVNDVCSCDTGSRTCNSTCLTQSLLKPNTYYTLAKELYWNVTDYYPNSDIWMVGHSLGGAVAALLGATYGLPSVTFESPGEAMAAKRLGLPTPPGHQVGAEEDVDFVYGAYHFGNTADPLFLGTCTGWPCTWPGGFAMQSQCHSGHECVWNTTRDLGWGSHLDHHRIINVVDQIIPAYNKTPECAPVKNCVDCYKWKYFESNHSDSTSSYSRTSRISQTITQTCETPGWWGCLDESTSSGATATKSTSRHSRPHKTTSTSSCQTPGWFGCKDPTTSTQPTPTSTSTSSCKTPGWFGCDDPTTSTEPTPTTSPVSSTSATCETPGWFGRCLDRDPSTIGSQIPIVTATATRTAAPSSTSATCLHPGLFFGCKDRPSPGSSPFSATPVATAM